MGATAPARPGNAIGRMTGLTLFTPIRRQWLPLLVVGFFLARFVAGDPAPHPAVQLHQVRALVDRAHPAGREAAVPLPLLREQLRRALAALHRRLRLRHPEGHPPHVGPRHRLPLPAARRAAEGVDRAQQHGGRHLLLRLPRGEHAHGPQRAGRARACRGAGARRRAPRARGVQGRLRALPRRQPGRTSDGRVAQPPRRRLRADRLHGDPARPRGRAARPPRGAPARRARARSRAWTRCTSRASRSSTSSSYQGPPQKRETLRSSHLLFTSTFDGDLDPYLDAICERIGAEADAWWGHCVGYPGTRRPRRVQALHPRAQGRHQPVRLGQPERERAAACARASPCASAWSTSPPTRRASTRPRCASASWPPSGICADGGAAAPRAAARTCPGARASRPTSTSPTSRATSCAATPSRRRPTCSCTSMTPNARAR